MAADGPASGAAAWDPVGEGGAGAADGAPVGGRARPSLAWWATILTRGEVSARIRLRRAVVAALSALSFVLLAIFAALLLIAPRPVVVEEEVVASVEADEVPEVLLNRPIRVREVAVVRAAVVKPADVVIRIPPDRAMQLNAWTLTCRPSAFTPPQTRGKIPAGATSFRIPQVPPVPCDVTFTGGSVQVAVTAGVTRTCAWQGNLVCR